MLKANPGNIAKIVSLAIDKLPLDQIATGATNDGGMGLKYEAHHSLAQVVSGLGQYPGVGWPLIAASLKSPVVQTRNAALRTLRQWPKEVWTPEMYRALNKAKRVARATIRSPEFTPSIREPSWRRPIVSALITPPLDNQMETRILLLIVKRKALS